jgi:hypothetical protein
MRDGGAAEGNGLEMLAGGIGGFADGFGDLVGLAETNANLAFAVTHDEERAEAETATALDDLGASVDEDDFFEEIGFVLIATAARPAITAGSATTTTSTLTATATRSAPVIATAFGTGRDRSAGSDRGDFRHIDNRIGDHGFYGNFLFSNGIGIGRHRDDN